MARRFCGEMPFLQTMEWWNIGMMEWWRTGNWKLAAETGQRTDRRKERIDRKERKMPNAPVILPSLRLHNDRRGRFHALAADASGKCPCREATRYVRTLHVAVCRVSVRPREDDTFVIRLFLFCHVQGVEC
jgi:hypothetical protein